MDDETDAKSNEKSIKESSIDRTRKTLERVAIDAIQNSCEKCEIKRSKIDESMIVIIKNVEIQKHEKLN